MSSAISGPETRKEARLVQALLAGALSLNTVSAVSQKVRQSSGDSGASITTASPVIFEAIRGSFCIPEPKKVLPILSRHPSVCNALLRITPHIHEMFPGANAVLELIVDIEREDPDYIAVSIPTTLHPEVTFPLWLALQERMIHTIASCNGLLSIDLRYE